MAIAEHPASNTWKSPLLGYVRQRMAAKKRKQIKVVNSVDYTPLEIHAIQIREFYTALRKAGFDASQSLTLCVMQDGWPDWFGLPAKTAEDIGTIIDEEDDD